MATHSHLVHPASAILGVLFLFLTSPLAVRSTGLFDYAVQSRQPEQFEKLGALQGITVGEETSLLPDVLSGDDRIELFNKVRTTAHKQELTQGEYMETVRDGVSLLRNVVTSDQSVIVFDFANPFSFILSLEPPRGDYSWFHAERNISEDEHLLAEELFGTVQFVMLPRFPVNFWTTELLIETYGDYLTTNYRLHAATDYWHLYEKK